MANAPPIDPRIRTVGRSQRAQKSVELCTRIQLAPYFAGWNLATFLAPIVTGRNKLVALQPQTPRRPSYSRLQVPGWKGPPYFHAAEFQSLLTFVPTLQTEQTRDSPPAIPETQPWEQEYFLLRAHYVQRVALCLLLRPQTQFLHNSQTSSPSYNNNDLDSAATTLCSYPDSSLRWFSDIFYYSCFAPI